MTARVTRKEFDRHYGALVHGRSFVEFEDYYLRSADRFWKAFDAIQKMNLPSDAAVLDIGGGIMGCLLARILGLAVTVGDVNRRAAADVAAIGVRFVDLNLLKDDEPLPEDRFDLVILQEVIGHLPVPPYVPLSRIRSRLKPEGRLFLTTPNASRLRNVLYLLSGREVLDHFRFPEGEEALGVQQEYTLRQMVWHFEKAGFVVTFGAHYNCGWRGRSRLAATAHLFLRPLTGIAHLKSGLMITGLNPSKRADFLSLLASLPLAA